MDTIRSFSFTSNNIKIIIPNSKFIWYSYTWKQFIKYQSTFIINAHFFSYSIYRKYNDAYHSNP